MIVQALGSQHLGQLSSLPRTLLDLGPLVLEPNLDLILVQTKLVGQVFSPLLRQISVLLKLFLQSAQLIGGECRSWSLLPTLVH